MELHQYAVDVMVLKVVALGSIAAVMLCVMCLGPKARKAIAERDGRALKPLAYAQWGMAVFKGIVAVLLFTALYPQCPAGCSCDMGPLTGFYPYWCAVIGVLWFLRGTQMYLQAAAMLPSAAPVLLTAVSANAEEGMAANENAPADDEETPSNAQALGNDKSVAYV